MPFGLIRTLTLLLALGLATSCAMKQKKIEKQVTSGAPVNCATAEGDLRVLKSEKTHVAGQILEGVTAITPAGAVLGIITMTEGTKLKVAVGEYNKQIDARIAQIKSECGM